MFLGNLDQAIIGQRKIPPNPSWWTNEFVWVVFRNMSITYRWLRPESTPPCPSNVRDSLWVFPLRPCGKVNALSLLRASCWSIRDALTHDGENVKERVTYLFIVFVFLENRGTIFSLISPRSSRHSLSALEVLCCSQHINNIFKINIYNYITDDYKYEVSKEEH